MKLKTLFTTLALFVAVGLCTAPLAAQTTGTTNLSLNLGVAGTLSVQNSASAIAFTGPAFGPWTSADTTIVNFAYRAGSTASSGVSITVSSDNGASALVGSNASNVIPSSDLTLSDTAASSLKGSLVASTALSAAATTLFTNSAASHANNQSFTVTYQLGAGDFAADTYTGTLTYTLAVS